ncbi:nuclear transport factor 2 family protein [Metabacillus sp. 84]|uniref:nuclear transport factor 2 family protein n=1 Tax=Metabacillus sp. 84 TaxID=3404705 RepID=UPI003CF1C886
MMMNEYVKIMDQFFQGMLENNIEQWMTIWHKDAVFEIPYAPSGVLTKLEGIDAIYNHVKDFPEKMNFTHFSEPNYYPVEGQNTVIVEFECEAVILETGLPYNQKYISVIEYEDGKILRYKDYWNPLIFIGAYNNEPQAFLKFLKRSQ